MTPWLTESLAQTFAQAATAAAARWLPLLADGALKGTIVLAAAAGATRIMRRGGAATRHLVWSAAVAGVLALPALSLVAPSWSVPIGLARTDVPRLPSSIEVPDASVASPAVPVPSPAAPVPPDRSRSIGPVESVPPSPAASSPFHLSLAAWVGVVWALGTGVVLARLLLGTIGLARLVRHSRPAADPSWIVLMQRLSRELGIRRPVTLLVGRTGTVPVTWGIVYPIVLLPADADTWSDERRRAVLLHELAHVERFDALTHVVSQLALALFWFHPLVLLAAHRLRAERERACDDLVLVAGTRATAYADDLLDLVRTLGSASPAAAALAMARRSEFEGRLLSILDPAVPRARTSRRAAVAACVVAAVAIVPLAGAHPAWRQPPATPSVAASPSALAVAAAPASESMSSTVVVPAPPPAAASPAAPAAPAASVRLAALGTASGPCRPRSGRHVSISNDGQRSHTLIADAVRCVEVQIDGRVEFNDDDTDIESLSRGGMLMIAETRGGVTRQVSVHERGGRLERSYTVDGAPSAASAGEAWLRELIPMLARESTIGVQRRVARIRRQRGVAGVLDEAGKIASDGVRRAWFETLLTDRTLDDDDLRQAALRAGTTFSSDGDKASVLRAIADRANGSPSVGMAVVTASQSIASDGDRRSVLARLTSDRDATGAVLTYAVQSAKGIASDGDKAALLRALAPRAGTLPALRSAIADAAGRLASDGDRASVLVALLAASPDDETLVTALRAVRGIASDGDRRQVLTAALGRTQLASTAVREAFFSAADAIASDGDHATLLLAVLRHRDLPDPALLATIRSAAKIASDGDKATVLLAVAARTDALADPAAREAFFSALRTVSSGSDYRRVMERVAR